MDQQRVMVYQGTQPIQAQTGQRTGVPAVPQRSPSLAYRELHQRLGIVQMCFGSLCVIFSIIGILIGYNFNHEGYLTTVSGAGIYTGTFYIAAGLLGLLAYRYNSKPIVVACMILNIIGTCVTVIGMIFIGLELTVLYRFSFQKFKCCFLIICCAIEFIITVVHAAFSGASFCDCCPPREAPPREVTRPTAVQAVPQVTIIPGQAYQLPQQQSMAVQQQSGHLASQHLVHNHPQHQLGDRNRQDNAFNAQQDTSQLIQNEITPSNAPLNSPPPYAELSIGK